jgi:endogenous inhibitor of DNA gyrase (YacG/DUF329 family)
MSTPTVSKPMTCERCDGPLEQLGVGRPRRFCSDRCRLAIGLTVRPAFDCVLCGTHVEQMQGGRGKTPRYCSKTCSQRASYLAGSSGGRYRRARVETDPVRREQLYDEARAYSRDRRGAQR